MKMFLKKKIAMFMAVVLMVPVFMNLNLAEAGAAATPTFTKTKAELSGVGATYQLEIKNKVDKSTYKWSTSSAEIATVSDAGLVTAVNKGTATIKCKVTYPSKKTKTLSCKVTVTIPATAINITNAVLTNGAQVMDLYETMDFEAALVPANSSDSVFWSVTGGDAGCITVDDAAAGKITAVKAGKVILSATAAKAATKEAAASSHIIASVIVEVKAPSTGVSAVNVTDSNTIVAIFDSPVMDSSVIGTNNALSANIEVVMRKDAKGVLASDPGALTATLSTDKKTLTIKTAKSLNGNYGVSLSNSVLTSTGLALEPYYKQITYIDAAGPSIISTIVDDSGAFATITFNETVNFDSMKVFGATAVANGVTIDAATRSTLDNILNYTVGSDKKTLKVNLVGIAAADKGKLLSVYISGLKDTAGNIPASVYLTSYIQTDSAVRPQPQVLYIQRTGYYTLTATFDRSVQVPGNMQTASGAMVGGSVDVSNTKKVNFTIPENEVTYTGLKSVGLVGWKGYNVAANDTSTSSLKNYNVDYSIETVKPAITTYTYDAETSVLTLNFSESVSLLSASGAFSAKLVTTSDEIRSGTAVTYTNVTHTEGDRIIKLKLANVSTPGTYTFNIEIGFVQDGFRNVNDSRAITLTTAGGGSTALPAPTSVYQSTTNPDQIVITFANKLDKVSAETAGNYTIQGVTIIKAELFNNTAETGATVILTMLPSSVAVTVSRPIIINGVKGYNDSFSPIVSYTTNVDIKENKKPSFVSAVFDSTARNVIRLNFDEAIQGNMVVSVSQGYGTSSIPVTSTVSISGNSVVITLGQIPMNGGYLKVDILQNNITDTLGNAANTMTTQVTTIANY